MKRHGLIIASDGLDVGAPDLLRNAMRELERRSAGVVWLNPLLETEGYEPTAAGMRAARPHISTLPASRIWTISRGCHASCASASEEA